VYLGVLEADGEGTVRNNENVLSRPDVRVAFRFENGTWTAMPHLADNPQALEALITSYPETVSWVLALDGMELPDFVHWLPSPDQIMVIQIVGSRSI
jgi:hypothetical protein